MSALPFLVWAFETLAWKPDLIIHECTEAFDTNSLLKMFGAFYAMFTFIFCPNDLGWPARRRRRYTLLVDKARRLIPYQVNQLLFSALFFRRCVLDGHVFWCAPSDMVAAFLAAGAARKHMPQTDEDGRPWANRDVLSEGYLQRLLGYERMLKRARRNLTKYIYNIHQTCTYTRSMSPIVPALMTRTSVIWSGTHQRVLIPEECLRVMGIKACGDNQHAAAGVERLHKNGKLNDHQVNLLAGNAMVQIAVGAVLMFALGISNSIPSELVETETESAAESAEFSADADPWQPSEEPQIPDEQDDWHAADSVDDAVDEPEM